MTTSLLDYRRVVADRDRWLRLFNRLDRAIVKHRQELPADTQLGPDEELYAVHAKVLAAASRGQG